MQQKRATITAVGGYVPDDKLTNFDLEKMVETNDEWIRTRTGIEERRILKGEGLATSDMCAEAVRGLKSQPAVATGSTFSTNVSTNFSVDPGTDTFIVTVDDVRAWYKQWYAPANATLIVVGDVTLAQVRSLTEQYFAGLPTQAVPRRAAIRELDTPGERTLTMTLPGQVPSLYLGFNLPSLASAATPQDAYALQLLSGVLDGGIRKAGQADAQFAYVPTYGKHHCPNAGAYNPNQS